MELFLLSLFCTILSSTAVAASNQPFDIFDRVQRNNPTWQGSNVNGGAAPSKRQASSPYLNANTEKFAVDGSSLPEVDFDIGESYAGLLPISQGANETRQLFFWFFPSSNPAASKEVTIWLNGGPGCSSLSGLLQENGPFLWQAGTLAPTPNTYSWSNLTNMLFVEQPVGTGYTQGGSNITNEFQLGQQFVGFYKNFINAFELQGSKTYITGESYAGYYVPYIADAFISANDKTYYDLAGIAINDPIIGNGILQEELPVVPYVDYWNNLLDLNDTFVAQLRANADACGYTEYYNTYFTFPPPGKFPAPLNPTNETCDLQDAAFSAALDSNPCFNIYHITDTCPYPYSILGPINTGDYVPPGLQIYFNRSDVKAAIHAPNVDWSTCKSGVFSRGRDQSPGPALNGVLQRVIEYTNNAIIGSGDLDFLLPTNGTLLAIQNLTWNGAQGFSTDPRSANTFYVPFHTEYNGGSQGQSGSVGNWGTERGLTFYNIELAGHELPGYSLTGGYRVLEVLLGRVPNLGSQEPFTTQSATTAEAPVRRSPRVPRMPEWRREVLHN